ncbi:hypothetical protein V5799_033537 [Amblyomma americanum]|uniref:Kinesin motor domain-containing protein n=1 Tax=Amblyomma americanum TaxID=6943 RepID=A0AAQ4DN14_AMBAM
MRPLPKQTGAWRFRNLKRTRPRDASQRLPQGRGQSLVIVNIVFAASTTQQDFYNTTGLLRPVQYLIDGHEVSIFAYGQTGIGNTSTVEGPAAQK